MLEVQPRRRPWALFGLAASLFLLLAALFPMRSGDGSETFTYGSGTDRRRTEYREGVRFQTPTVNGAAWVRGWSGIHGWIRTAFWGFDPEHLPLNGRVYMPEGTGPFPLVLILHGNHWAEEYSDPGYGYLGGALAKQGYIAVSIDANFLNSSWYGSLQHEVPARAWLLLEHLRLWESWSEEEGHPLAGQVDLSRVALVGHSRGGEAAAAAAVLNQLPLDPGGRGPVPNGYGIRSVVAIAPTDIFYDPGGKPISPVDVNFLGLWGSHDADLLQFQGSRLYERVTFSGEVPAVKANVYLHGANHGQFNSEWGQYDPPVTDFRRALVDVEQLIPQEDQQQIAIALITDFLDSTLVEEPSSWQPPTVEEVPVRVVYENSTFVPIADFSEDNDLTTATWPGATAVGQGFYGWWEDRVWLRLDEPGEGQALYLAWAEWGASYEIDLGVETDPIVPGQHLAVTVGLPAGYVPESAVWFGVGLRTDTYNSRHTRIALEPLPVQLSVVPWLEREVLPATETVFETYTLDLSSLVGQRPQSISLRFDQSWQGQVMVRKIGFLFDQ